MKQGKNVKKKYSQDEIVNHLKATGYFFQNSDISSCVRVFLAPSVP